MYYHYLHRNSALKAEPCIVTHYSGTIFQRSRNLLVRDMFITSSLRLNMNMIIELSAGSVLVIEIRGLE